MIKNSVLLFVGMLTLVGCATTMPPADQPGDWLLVSDFEREDALDAWTNVDVENETDPFVPDAQITELSAEAGIDNQYMLRKPAADGVIGNRKALGFVPLPTAIGIGETYSLYTRVNVEYFPNNHSFGLSNLTASEIPDANYDAFEPIIRITDKAESDGTKNDGTLMVSSGYKSYAKIINPETGAAAKPLAPDVWYEVWAVMDNSAADAGGQSYEVYVRGGEFTSQTLVYSGASFRMKRGAPLTAFIAISNTGSKKQPYGNGGVRYDDIYIAKNKVLSTPGR
ncbi:MAG: hypothetical protein EX271_08260 [Acidimicrobiales bacterium]|nr:MAG: hypothetical protein EX271_08260 [Acidimicrobiales bacterium]